MGGKSAATTKVQRKGVPYPTLTPEELWDNRLKATTLNMYRGLVQTLVREGYSPDYQGLEGRICDGRPITSGQLRNTINAVQHHRYRLFRGEDAIRNGIGIAPMSEREMTHLRGLVAGRHKYGVRNLGLPETKKRGAITKDMLDDLLKWMEEKEKTEGLACNTGYRNALRICWATGLRTCQMNQICWNNFKKGKSGDWFLHVEKIHTPCTCNQSSSAAGLAILVDKSIYNLLEMEVTRHSLLKDAKVAEFWIGTHVNKWIQRAASDLCWADNLLVKFDGVHCLRHGIATETYAVTGDYVIVQNILGHQSKGVTQDYSNPNSLRSAEYERRMYARERELQMRAAQQNISLVNY